MSIPFICQMEEYERVADNDRERIYRLQREVEELRDCRRTAAEAENQILDLNNQIRFLEEEAQLGKLFKVIRRARVGKKKN